MQYWKLGVRWGSKSEGKPSFYNLIKSQNIVITHDQFPFRKGDIILIADGHTILALARVLETLRPITELAAMEAPFKKHQIDYESFVKYAAAEWIELSQGERFLYKLQQGICKVGDQSTLDSARSLWEKYTQSPGYSFPSPFQIKKKSKFMNPYYGISLNQILFGPPGTGKTYNTINMALKLCGKKVPQARRDAKKEFDKLVEQGRIVFTTFHQSMTYEDFIEGIKPSTSDEENSEIQYQIEPGIFKSICIKANPLTGNFEEVIEEFKNEISEPDGNSPLRIKSQSTTFDVKYTGKTVFYVQPLNSVKKNAWYPVNIEKMRIAHETGSEKGFYNPTYIREILRYLVKTRGLVSSKVKKTEKENYVLIIDEINRGNVSEIFGELITLIEADKRLGNEEQLEAILPYSKDKFGVPSNLYIIGTMNTADRSVEALDSALRRRFSFIEMPPIPGLIQTEGKLKNTNGILGDIDLSLILSLINKRLEKLLNKDHKIGHSYFLSVEDLEGLKRAFQRRIIPLLQEFFYGDFGKIGLVIGRGFLDVEVDEGNSENYFAKFDDYEISSLAERKIFRVKNVEEMDDSSFKEAIRLLENP